jgi:16S rRNA processing protein RimM
MGLRGEVRITLHAQDSVNLKEGKVLLLDNAASGDIRARIKSVRYQKDRPVIKLEGFDDRTAVEALRGMEVSIEADDLEELPEGEHYVRNLIGCRVVDIAGGGSAEIGVLEDVIQNTAQSVLDVRTPDGTSVLIPAVDAFLRRIDEDEKLIEVELIPGFY